MSGTTRRGSAASKGNRRPARGPGGRRARVSRPATPAALSPRKRPRQERARATFDAILQAAAGLIARDGYASLTTNKVAERAGVSIGSLYQYFPNKEAILVALLEQHMAGVEPLIELSLREQADPRIPFEVGMRRLLERLLERHRDHPRLQRALTEEVPQPKHIRALHQRQDREYTRRVAEILRQRPDVRVQHVEAAAHVLVVAVSALARWLAHEPSSDVDPDACLDEVVRLLSAYTKG